MTVSLWYCLPYRGINGDAAASVSLNKLELDFEYPDTTCCLLTGPIPLEDLGAETMEDGLWVADEECFDNEKASMAVVEKEPDRLPNHRKPQRQYSSSSWSSSSSRRQQRQQVLDLGENEGEAVGGEEDLSGCARERPVVSSSKPFGGGRKRSRIGVRMQGEQGGGVPDRVLSNSNSTTRLPRAPYMTETAATTKSRAQVGTLEQNSS